VAIDLRFPLALGLLGMAVAACAPLPPRNPLAQWVPSANHELRKPVLIVIHHTEEDSVQESLHTLRTRNSQGPVSAHYLVGHDGKRYQLVADNERAWHAGAGSWHGLTDINSISIGIELDNNGIDPFPAAQIDSLLVLLEDLCERYSIARSQIIGHADLAPVRKVDPSREFPWKRLADAGFGLWPGDADIEVPPGFDPWLALRLIGYSLDDRPATVRAFHLHFRGIESVELDDEDLRILHALTMQILDTTP
jgi:N-acetylmuramoyl-L-alanine amidase